MNGPTSMYKIRPVIKLAEEIELPECMYKMKNIQESYFNPSVDHLSKHARATSISEQCPLPEVVALESRQEAILEQLAQLKCQMTALRAELKQTPSSVTATQITTRLISCTTRQNDITRDIVVNANPHRPPYSLLALCRLWSNSIELRIHSHVHSTILELPQNLRHFQSFGTGKTNCRLRDSLLLNVILVWKNVADTELVISPSEHTAVRGEVNILRFLSHFGPSEYNYELCEPSEACCIDALLDISYNLSRIRLVKDRQALIRLLNAQLKKSLYFVGNDSMSLADVAVWSVLRQLGDSFPKDLPVSMSKWFQRCEQQLAPES